MNRLDEITLHHGKNGIIDVVKNKYGTEVLISVCNPNGIGAHQIRIKMPEDTAVGIMDIERIND